MNWKERVIDIVNDKFHRQRILVIGDLMVDEYIIGKVNRISPEAPVPVLDYCEKKLVAGGASNVAYNLKSLGANVLIAGVAAKDDAGNWLRDYLNKNEIETSCVLAEDDRPTTLKTRFSVKGQQLLRVDSEVTNNITAETQNDILEYVKLVIDRIDALVISDYTKGVLGDPEFVKEIISLCNEHQVFVAVDSKSRNIYAFSGSNLVKPNNLELEEAVGIKIKDEDSLNRAGEKYLLNSGTKALVVTRGAMGISVFESNDTRKDYPAKNVQVFDVSGAGDTVISTITMGLCANMSMSDAVRLANLAAGVVISKIGTVAISKKELLECIDEE